MSREPLERVAFGRMRERCGSERRRRRRALRASAALGLWLAGSLLVSALGRSWGASRSEAREPMAGDSLITDPVAQSTRAITIQAPPAEVWPWLVQIGQDRGGFYTYEWIENALGARIRNADRIVPELQELAVGDLIRLTPDPYLGRIPGQSYEVREVRPQQALVLLQELPSGGATTWSFILRDADGGSTRLLVRARDSAPPHRRGRVARRVEQLLLGPGYLVMDRGMLRGIRRRAIARTSPPSGKGPGPGAAQLGRPLASAL